MERKQTFEKEHKDALERAVTLNVPHAVPPTEASTEEDTSEGAFAESQNEETSSSNLKSSGKPNWNELVEKLFDRSESGNLVLKEDANVAVH